MWYKDNIMIWSDENWRLQPGYVGGSPFNKAMWIWQPSEKKLSVYWARKNAMPGSFPSLWVSVKKRSTIICPTLFRPCPHREKKWKLGPPPAFRAGLLSRTASGPTGRAGVRNAKTSGSIRPDSKLNDRWIFTKRSGLSRHFSGLNQFAHIGGQLENGILIEFLHAAAGEKIEGWFFYKNRWILPAQKK